MISSQLALVDIIYILAKKDGGRPNQLNCYQLLMGPFLYEITSLQPTQNISFKTHDTIIRSTVYTLPVQCIPHLFDYKVHDTATQDCTDQRSAASGTRTDFG
jgi:hypothetical protein